MTAAKDRKGTPRSDLIESILASPDRVVVLTGPAGSGKTEAALELYRRRAGPIGRAGCVIIVPNEPAMVRMRAGLLEKSGNLAILGPAVTTFSAFAGKILTAVGKPSATLGKVQRLLLLERIVAQLHAAGALKAIGPVASSPGLAAVLDASIAELKRAAVEPDALAAAIDRRRGRDADLLAVYRRYQRDLLDTGRFDVEGQMWLARDVLAGGSAACPGFEDVTAVAVDGFTDFTPTQLEILALLPGSIDKILITLPLIDSQPGRRLWFWTGRTLERIGKAFDGIGGGTGVIAADKGPGPLGRIFDLSGQREIPARRDRKSPPFSITLLEAPDVEAEVRAVARSVKADLVGGAFPGSIAVVARDIEPYAEPIERIFTAHGIDVRPRPTRLDASGVIRYVLRLLALRPDYEFHDVLAVIKNSYFRPSALGPQFSPATVATAEMAIRTANVLGGRDAYAQALGRLASLAGDAAGMPDDDERIELGPLACDAQSIDNAADMLETLLSRLERLASAKTASDYVHAVRALVRDMEVRQAVTAMDDDCLLSAELRAMAGLETLLEEVASAGRPASQPEPDRHGSASMSPQRTLARAAAVASCAPARGPAAVQVLDVPDVRSLRFDRLYMLGVNEKAFPRLAADRCFITESDRAAWASRGVALDRRSDLVSREMLLFYLGATRARKHLTVSYLAGDSAGGRHTPSTFVEELETAAAQDGVAVTRRRVEPGQFVPPREELACPYDAFNAAILWAFDDRPGHGGGDKSLLGWAAKHRGQLLERTAMGLIAAQRRWSHGPADAFDGRIDDRSLLKTLAGRIPDEWVFSATELNSYAACPWRFFARYLLRLDPLVEPVGRLDPAARGIFCHAVLWQVMTDLARRSGRPVNLAEIRTDDLKDALDRAVKRQRERLAGRAVHSQLWDVQTRYWRQLLWRYLSSQQERSPDLPAGRHGRKTRSMYFELGFGLERGGDGFRDAASRAGPVRLQAGGQAIDLRGKIDRVDLVQDESLLAVDYKTGIVPAAKDMLQGRDLQLPLYAKALEAMFDSPCAGGVYHGLRDGKRRFFATFKMPGREKVDYEQALERVMETVGLHVRAMSEGVFDATPAGKCSKWCPYRQVCQYSKHRARLKTPGDQAAGPEDGDG